MCALLFSVGANWSAVHSACGALIRGAYRTPIGSCKYCRMQISPKFQPLDYRGQWPEIGDEGLTRVAIWRGVGFRRQPTL